MYQIIFSINNNEEVMVLPHVPPDFEIPQPPSNGDTFEGMTRDYSRFGTEGLRAFSIDSFFPVGRRYPFMPTGASTNGWAYVDFFKRGRARRLPFRVIVLDSHGVARLNMACMVDSFTPKVRRNGDIAYSMAITEYRWPGGS